MRTRKPGKRLFDGKDWAILTAVGILLFLTLVFSSLLIWLVSIL
jgi:hypothetical protein